MWEQDQFAKPAPEQPQQLQPATGNPGTAGPTADLQAARLNAMGAGRRMRRGRFQKPQAGLIKQWMGSPGARENPLGKAYAQTRPNPLVGAAGGTMRYQRPGRGRYRGRGRRLGWANARRPAQRRFQGQLRGLYEKQLKGQAGATFPTRTPTRGRDFRRGFAPSNPPIQQQPSQPQPDIMRSLLGGAAGQKEQLSKTMPVAPAPEFQAQMQTLQGG